MKKQFQWPLSIFFVLLALGSYSYYGKFLLNYALCLKWHINNDNKISMINYEITLPDNWWIAGQRKPDEIMLARVPFVDDSYFGRIVLMKKNVSEATLEGFKKIREIQGSVLIKQDGINKIKIDNEIAYGIEYLLTNSDKYEGKIDWTWSVPSKNLVVAAINFNPRYKQNVIDELFNNIKFSGKF